MPFLDKLYPHIITKIYWWFKTPCKQKVRAKRVNNKIRKKTDWIKGSEKITQKLENIKNTEDTIELVVFSINKTEITIFSINKIEIIQKKLEQLYSEDPLKGWEKHKTIIKIELIEKSGISLSKKKAEIMKNQIEFLGIQIDKSGVKMQQHIE